MKNSQKNIINWQRLRVSGAPNSTKHVAWTGTNEEEKHHTLSLYDRETIAHERQYTRKGRGSLMLRTEGYILDHVQQNMIIKRIIFQSDKF